MLPTIISRLSDLAGVVNVVGSAIGLWAILYSNARAVKLFLRSQALVFVMEEVNLLVVAIASSKAKTTEYWATIAFACIFSSFFSLYNLKVRMVFFSTPFFVLCFLLLPYVRRFPSLAKQALFVSTRIVRYATITPCVCDMLGSGVEYLLEDPPRPAQTWVVALLPRTTVSSRRHALGWVLILRVVVYLVAAVIAAA